MMRLFITDNVISYIFFYSTFLTFSPYTKAALSPAIDELESGYNTIVDENNQIILSSILKVGDRFSNRLKEIGYKPLHSKTLHEPHDANAYQRSRCTFMKLLERQPAAL